MPSRCILLAGAPEADRLDWRAESLTADFNTPVKRFLNGEQAPAPVSATWDPTPTSVPPKWRALNSPDQTGEFGPPFKAGYPQSKFLSFGASGQAKERDHQNFLEHSLAILSQLDSSQIAGPEESTAFLSTHSFATSDTSLATAFDPSSQSPKKDPPEPNVELAVQIRGDITDLSRIVPADHVTRIQPQTMTINIIAAVISIAPARTVSLRRQSREMEIFEVLLGDETKAGFTVSFWLSPIESQSRSGASDDLRITVEALRSGDVILLQNVALSVWKGCVYGQSLARRMFRRTATVVTVLGEENSGGGMLPREVLGKIGRVRRWAEEFVGGRVKWSGREADMDVEPLPADTQEQDTVWG